MAINEFLADNNANVADQNGEFDDWIEIHNYSRSTISLAGYSLSDDSTSLYKWTFPDTSVSGGGFITVWADNDTSQTGLHAGFKLDSDGEQVVLSGSDGNVIDYVTYEEQTDDISIGRFPDGIGAFQAMVPTFDDANSSELPPQEIPNDTLFATSIVHKFELEFYTEYWQDSLSYNYEVLDQNYMPARLTYNDDIVLDSIGVRYKGNSSYIRSGASIKKPFKLKFDKYHSGQTLYDAEVLNFSNCVADPSFMREIIGYRISGAYMAAPIAVYANIYVEGELIGLYVQVEQVDEIFLKSHFAKSGSKLYKASDDGATLLYLGEDQSNYESEYELKTNENGNDWSRFITLIDVLNNTADEAFVATISLMLNLDSVINHLAFNMVLSNFDSYTGSGRNFYFYDDKDSDQFYLIPWDLNETFGVYTNNWNVINADIVELQNDINRPLVRRIMQNDSLRMIYLERVGEMIEGVASTDSVSAVVDQLRPFIEEHVLADPNKLYSDELFFNNLEDDVRIELGHVIPGIASFSAARNENIRSQLIPIEVYPGDCDNNGVVDAGDILPIGVYFHNAGFQRDEHSVDWNPLSSTRWYSKASTYADVNGDGIIDERDIIGIGVNWGNSEVSSSISYEIDLSNMQMLRRHRDAFVSIYKSLQGDNEVITEMRSILESIITDSDLSPNQYSLAQNFPNPFNSTTIIKYNIPESKTATLTIFDQSGRKVRSDFANKWHHAGQHRIMIDASMLVNGVYMYRLQADNWSQSAKMMLIK